MGQAESDEAAAATDEMSFEKSLDSMMPLGKTRERTTEVFGKLMGGEHVHVWVGPKNKVERAELATFMVSRGIGEQLGRIIEHRTEDFDDVWFSCLQTEATLGAGSFGRVLKVVDVRTMESYAMKLQKKTKAGKQAMREAEQLKQYKHPFIVRLVRIFHTSIFYGILMEFCEMDLNVAVIKASEKEEYIKGLPPPLVQRYTVCIMFALEYIHRHKVIFRDLKLENVLISSQQKDNFAKLADFGMARTVDAARNEEERSRRKQRANSATSAGSAPRSPGGNRLLTIKAGTLAFMSDEAMNDQPSDEDEMLTMDWFAARDWYGLGCCLFLMLVGEQSARKVGSGKRVVLLPPQHDKVIDSLKQTLDADLINQDAFDVACSLCQKEAEDRGNSKTMRNAPFLEGAIAELEQLRSAACETISDSDSDPWP